MCHLTITMTIKVIHEPGNSIRCCLVSVFEGPELRAQGKHQDSVRHLPGDSWQHPHTHSAGLLHPHTLCVHLLRHLRTPLCLADGAVLSWCVNDHLRRAWHVQSSQDPKIHTTIYPMFWFYPPWTVTRRYAPLLSPCCFTRCEQWRPCFEQCAFLVICINWKTKDHIKESIA